MIRFEDLERQGWSILFEDEKPAKIISATSKADPDSEDNKP